MIYKINSFLKIISPAAIDQENRKIATEKLNAWVAAHEKEMNEVRSALKLKREKIWSVVGKGDIVKEAIRELGNCHQSSWTDEVWNYYQIIEDFVKNKLFKFKFETFYPFVLRKTLLNNSAPLDRESLVTFLAENQAEEGSISIDDYLEGKKDSQESKRFFYSLNRKVENENIEISNLVAELLSLHLSIECDDWSSVATNMKFGLSFQDFIFLVARHFYTIKNISNDTFLFLEGWLKKQEETILPDKENMYKKIILREMVARKDKKEISQAGLAFFELLDQSVVDFDLMRFLFVRNDLLDSICPNNIIKNAGSEEVELVSLAVLKRIKQDPLVIEMLMGRDFFYNINFSPELLEKYKIDAKKVGEILNEATCEATKDIWRQLHPAVFHLMKESDAEKLKKSVLHFDVIIRVRQYQGVMPGEVMNEKKPALLENAIRDASDISSDLTNALLEACNDPIFFDALLRDRGFVNFIRENLILSINRLNGMCAKYPLPLFLKPLDELHAKRGKIWDNILMDSNILSALRAAVDSRRRQVLALSSFLSEKYYEQIKSTKKVAQNKPKIVISKEQQEANKAFVAQSKKVISTPEVERKPLSKPVKENKPAASAELPPPEKKTLDLTPTQIEDFSSGIRAVFAGNPDVDITWVAEKIKDVAGYFVVTFPEPNKKFKINKALNQTQTEFTLTEQQWHDFFYTYVPSKLGKDLPEVVVLKEANRLCIIPKTDHCSYPVDMHSAAFNHLSNKGAATFAACPQTSLFKFKKMAYHVASSLKSEMSLIADPQDEKTKQPTQDSAEQEQINVFDAVKQILNWMMEDDFDRKSFNFLTDKQRGKTAVIQVNLKAAAYLSDKNQQVVSTYALMKCMVLTLQSVYGLLISISPDNADQIKQGQCSITIKSKKEKLKEIMTNLSGLAKDVFKKHLEAHRFSIAQTDEIKHEEREVIVLEQTKENNQLPADVKQRFQINDDQLTCLYRLLAEAKMFNIQLADARLEPVIRCGLNAQRNVCYHRIFHNLTEIFEMNHDANYTLYANTYRDVFRHAHNELSADFIATVGAFIQAISQYKTEIKTNLFAQSIRFISWSVTKGILDALVNQIKPYVQEKSNHHIGTATKKERKALVPTWKDAIKQLYATQLIDEAIKQSMIVSLASLIGEVEKSGTPYQAVFVEMGTHIQNTAELPSTLTGRVYAAFICACHHELVSIDENNQRFAINNSV